MKDNHSLYNVRNINKYAVLDLIRFTPGGISRADLARKVGLSRSAVTSIVNSLMGNGIVKETNSRPSNGGRRPIMLEVNSNQGYVVGIDMGASHLGIILADLSARIRSEIEVPFDIKAGPKNCIRLMDDYLKELLDQSEISITEIKAIGVGVPGPVSIDTGTVIVPPIMPGWGNFPITSYLESLWNVPVSLGNDAELGALGEWAHGAGRGENYLAYIKVGSGVGAGFLFDGKIYRGATGSAGEIGHITIDNNGPKCNCGNRGCLETMAGGDAISRRARENIVSGQRTVLSELGDPINITAKDVAQAAARGDLLSQQIVADAGVYLGIAVANMINLFNPDIIVIGGGVAKMGDLLLEPIRKTTQERSLHAAARQVRITTAMLGRRSTSMGAVVQALTLTLHDMAEPLPA